MSCSPKEKIKKLGNACGRFGSCCKRAVGFEKKKFRKKGEAKSITGGGGG